MFRNLFSTAHKAVASFLTFYFKTQSMLSCATCFHRETLENPNAQLILYTLTFIFNRGMILPAFLVLKTLFLYAS